MDWEKELDQTAYEMCENKHYHEAAEYARDFIRVTIPTDLYEMVEAGKGKDAYQLLAEMYPEDVLDRLLHGIATMDDFFAIPTADMFVLMQGEEFLLPDASGKIEYIHLMRRMRFEPETYINFVEEEVFRLYRNMKHKK